MLNVEFNLPMLCARMAFGLNAVLWGAVTYAQSDAEFMKQQDYRIQKTVAELKENARLFLRDAEDFKEWRDGLCKDIKPNDRVVRHLVLKDRFSSEETVLERALGDQIDLINNRVKVIQDFIPALAETLHRDHTLRVYPH